MFITVHIYDVVGYILFGDEDGVVYTDTYMYIFGGWDWPGVGIGVLICT